MKLSLRGHFQVFSVLFDDLLIQDNGLLKIPLGFFKKECLLEHFAGLVLGEQHGFADHQDVKS
jgi:hypothetical protein